MATNRSAMELLEDFDKADGADYGDGDDVNDTGTDAGAEDEVSEGSTGDDSTGGPDDRARDPNADRPTTDRANNGQQPPVDQRQSNQQLQPVRGGLFADQQGNIVDPRNGAVLARAGSERRMFERSVRVQGEMERVGQELQQTRQNLERVNYLNDLPRKYQLGTDEVEAGLGIVAEFKKNPVEAARKVVELAASMGHNVSDILGKNAGDAIEMKAINRMLEEKLAPVLAPLQQQRETARVRQQAEQQLNSFLDQHDFAETHLPAINSLMGQHPDMSPQKAYYEIRSFAQQHGLDFSKPLKPQIAAIAAQQQQPGAGQRGNGQAPRQPASRPMPNGSAGYSARSTSEADFAPASSSWEDIIRGSM